MNHDAKCSHVIAKDSIDITPDKSATIYYCTLCYECFERAELTAVLVPGDNEPSYSVKPGSLRSG
jgi:hypothetical protein